MPKVTGLFLNYKCNKKLQLFAFMAFPKQHSAKAGDICGAGYTLRLAGLSTFYL